MRQFAKAVYQFGGHRLAFRIRPQRADTAIQAQANRQVANIGFWDQHRQTKADIRRPVALAAPRLALAGADVRHRVLQHLLIQLDANLADVAGLFIAQQIAGATNVQIVGREGEPGAECIQGLHHRQPLFRRRRQPMVRRPGQIGVAALLAAPNTAAQLIQLAQAEHIRPMDHQRVHRWHVQAAFDDIGR